ncbi:chorismate synthase [Pseudobacteriovorax antillogorgiicola]|uniref:Chorismate synthase n=1 Tax=Pseudobacteriovorax antillogorgiicola TaxID=1513793 RepID=A0A1Y6BAY8_9BACT|nr:chorismate synthase [Pseudobacteriovorax antillogorgiicola]TCS58869.1 chorismate synthase [Pseudobacteriovorax antillogorgiicola]SME93847.1 chorismate synthase [Pseudobacteriovorax antillogorgiicola]
MDNTFGLLYRITTFGESHGGAVGVVIDGCPAGHQISIERVQHFLNRRRPGQSHLSTPRAEQDQVECLSGLVNNISLGTPITLIVRNKDAKQDHYSDLAQVYRPSHADYTTDAKFGVKAPSGGGRASARETIGRVAAAAVAEQVLETLIPGYQTVAFVESVKDIKADIQSPESISREQVDQTPLRCPDESSQRAMEACIVAAKKKGDSVGGTIFCGIKNCLPGLGAPVFDKLEADLAKAMMSLPASKGFEVGSGFSATQLFGSEHNDEFENQGGKIRTRSNRSGGIQGGISNGEFIYLRVAFKPVATIFKDQASVDREGQEVVMKPKAGRHDPCVLPRAVPMIEAMATLVIMDHYLRQLAFTHGRGPHKV